MTKEQITIRVKHYLAMELHGYLSISMVIGLYSKLARSAGVTVKDVIDIVNEQSELITKDNCDVNIHFY